MSEPQTLARIAHASASLEEAERLMTVCNSCRYCEGLCAVFPAMEMRRSFSDGDLNYLGNLCHSCGACYVDCQFSPPHEFSVNVPMTLAVVRAESYQAYAWPRAFAPLFERNGLAVSLLVALSVTIFLAGFVGWHDPSVLWNSHSGPGAFYRLMPHNVMVAVFGAAFLYAIVASLMAVRNFWTDIDEPASTLVRGQSLWQAIKDASSLRYLDGGGVGCYGKDEKPTDNRRLYHHFTFYGFLLCFASTSLATLYHYLLGLEAPYPWYDLPVVLGTLGGVGLVIGPIGLFVSKQTRDPALQDEARKGMDIAFLAMLFLTGLTGLLLLILRATPAMGLLLAVHLGVVFGLFITLPYSKFMHGIYRFLALVRYAKERRSHDDLG
ncbi:tricarballylate utilization 4Fe-4S protein TcuB [Pelagibius sp. Alg239-R121]|uniref:tricarballylate utilization 4Fe-4S protein TcuB n=1 Tax=Pelagibius sp. Alg239-R121 TaxID=2993448 RepID=UPI0024A69D20|nr:tricarballylate utilization 4Fe-4S protein TcuB [Pelagibius sp. Alg239-R121]